MIHKGVASLTDCDTNGRSLLNVSNTNLSYLIGRQLSLGKYALEAINPEMCKYLLGYKVDANEFQLDRFGQLVYVIHAS